MESDPSTFVLAPFSELRIAANRAKPVYVTLSSRQYNSSAASTAEVLGYELAPEFPHCFNGSRPFVVYTWHGCHLSVSGVDSDSPEPYVVTPPPAISYPIAVTNCAMALRRLRHKCVVDFALRRPGPTVLVLGERSTGRTTVAVTLANIAAREYCCGSAGAGYPMFIDAALEHPVLGPPGAISLRPVSTPICPSDVASCAAISYHVPWNGGSLPQTHTRSITPHVAQQLVDSMADSVAVLLEVIHTAMVTAGRYLYGAGASAVRRGGIIIDAPPSNCLGPSGLAALIAITAPDVILVTGGATAAVDVARWAELFPLNPKLMCYLRPRAWHHYWHTSEVSPDDEKAFRTAYPVTLTGLLNHPVPLPIALNPQLLRSAYHYYFYGARGVKGADMEHSHVVGMGAELYPSRLILPVEDLVIAQVDWGSGGATASKDAQTSDGSVGITPEVLRSRNPVVRAIPLTRAVEGTIAAILAVRGGWEKGVLPSSLVFQSPQYGICHLIRLNFGAESLMTAPGSAAANELLPESLTVLSPMPRLPTPPAGHTLTMIIGPWRWSDSSAN